MIYNLESEVSSIQQYPEMMLLSQETMTGFEYAKLKVGKN